MKKAKRNSNASAVRAEARLWIRNGWQPVQSPFGLKGPRTKEWQNGRLTEADIAGAFPDPSNIGGRTGDVSSGLLDVDLDTRLAVEFGRLLLPATAMRHGRPGNPDSHRWYVNKDWRPGVVIDFNIETFTHPITGEMLVELRYNRHQTLIPPSFNDEIFDEEKQKLPGEWLSWEQPLGEPASISLDDLKLGGRLVASATLLFEHWKRARHRASLAMSGWMLLGGLAAETVERLLVAMARIGRANQRKIRLTVQDTAKNIAAGKAVSDAGTLRKKFGFPDKAIEATEKWLNLHPTIWATGTGNLARKKAGWPAPLSDAAFSGLAGKIAKTIRPHTEADDAAVLIHLLVACGSAMGRNAFFGVGADRHYPNLFAVVVGDTSKGRKGSSEGYVRRLLEMADPDWSAIGIAGGLSSGEGLIWRVRDRIVQQQPVRSKGRVTGYQEVRTDPGVLDKRLLVIENEFSQPLRVMSRDGNILSATIRMAWDRGDLSVLTKNSPGKATGAHISIIGHITRSELRRRLVQADASNGFANRFLWICARRSKLLPSGGALPDADLLPLADSLRRALEAARAAKGTQMFRSPKAENLWERGYEALSAQTGGLAGEATARGEAQVVRLALVYALLDKKQRVETTHLRAALEVWRYCADSAKFIFSAASGDPIADRVMEKVRARGGLTLTEINDLFGGHRSKGEIEAAIGRLKDAGLVQVEERATGGRKETLIVEGGVESR